MLARPRPCSAFVPCLTTISKHLLATNFQLGTLDDRDLSITPAALGKTSPWPGHALSRPTKSDSRNGAGWEGCALPTEPIPQRSSQRTGKHAKHMCRCRLNRKNHSKLLKIAAPWVRVFRMAASDEGFPAGPATPALCGGCRKVLQKSKEPCQKQKARMLWLEASGLSPMTLRSVARGYPWRQGE